MRGHIAGDIGGNYKWEGSADLSVLTFTAGPRIHVGTESVQLFLHTMGGFARARLGVDVFGVSVSAATTELTAHLGGGLDAKVAETVSIRLQGD